LASASFQFELGASAESRSWQAALPQFSEAVAREYYAGDVVVLPRKDPASLRIETTALGAVRVARFSSAAGTRTVRTWRHIRRDPCSLYLIWFVREGSVSVAQNGREAVVQAGEFAVTSSRRPFQIATSPEAGGLHDSYQVIVPSHLLAAVLPEAASVCGQPRAAGVGPAGLAQDIFLSLFNHAEALPPETTRRLAQEALAALALALRAETRPAAAPSKDARRALIYDYLEAHLGDSDLTAARVAAACRISSRYLYLLFAEDGRRFHDHLWSARLARARTLLADPRTEALQIAEIAYLVGFRSAAHFSRAFHARYGASPRDWRREARAPQSA